MIEQTAGRRLETGPSIFLCILPQSPEVGIKDHRGVNALQTRLIYSILKTTANSEYAVGKILPRYDTFVE